jgi:hypothetical protein
MGRAAARRAEYQEKEYFEEGHIAVVWDEFEDRFGVNSKGWKKKFDDAFMQQPHHVEKVPFFRKFLFENFNEILNHILCRYSHVNTTDKLIEYVARKRVK